MEKNETPARAIKRIIDNSDDFIEEIDKSLSHEQKKLMITLNCQKKRDEIEKMSKILKCDIKNLSSIIQEILDKHHKDYISTFSTFMDTVRKDLKLKLEQMEKIEEEKRKINDVKIIKCERDYFRLESIRMNKLCKKLSSKIEDMALRMKILSDEVNNLTIKWKDSEIANKQLFLELESSLQVQKEIENEMIQMKEMINTGTYNNNNNNSMLQLKTEQVTDDDESVDKYKELVLKLKQELKKEKTRNHKNMSELNKILLERNKLENIFIDCVEETRKTIFNRRLKESLVTKGTKIRKERMQVNINTNYETFLPTDKKAILENFVFNDDVSNIIREAIFSKPQREKEVKQITKSIVSRIQLPELTEYDRRGITEVSNNNNFMVKTGRMTTSNISRKHNGNNLALTYV